MGPPQNQTGPPRNQTGCDVTWESATPQDHMPPPRPSLLLPLLISLLYTPSVDNS